MDIRFEKAEAADAETLVDIQIRAFHSDVALYPDVEEGGPPEYDSVDVMLDDIAKGYCHKILADGKIIGGIVVFPREDGHFHLHIIQIDPAFHGKGIGKKAMAFIEAAYPATKWTLDTPAYATRNQHFYGNLGYVKVGEALEPDGLLLYSYEKIMPTQA